MKRTHVLMAVGLVVSGSLVFFGKAPEQADVAEPVVRPAKEAPAAQAATQPPREGRKGRAAAPAILPLIAREELIHLPGEDRHAQVFDAHSWGRRAQASIAPVAPVAPVAPPLPFVYLGKKFEEGTWEVYLSRGEETFIARAGGEVAGIYRVSSINPPDLVVVHLPTNQQQNLFIGGNE